jgi:hypothetical protein
VVEEVNQRQQRKQQLFLLWEGWPSEKEFRKLKTEKKKSVATDTTGSLSVDDTSGSDFSAVRVNSMRVTENFLCDSVQSHHMTANKK